MKVNLQKWHTTKEMAIILGVSKRRVQAMIKEGKFNAKICRCGNA